MRTHTARRRRLVLLCPALCLLPPLVPVHAAIVNWAVDADGLWSNPSNWSSFPSLPGSGDDVVIDRPAGNYLITMDSGNQTINSLTCNERLTATGGVLTIAAGSTVNNTFSLSGGTLAGAGSLTLTGAATFDSGTLTGVTTVANTTFQSGLTISGGLAKTFTRRTITNPAAATWSAGQMNTGVGAIFLNTPTGTFTTSFDGSWLYNQGGALSSFSNQGTFTKTGGTGATVMNLEFDNSGVVNVNSGTLRLTNGGSDSGTFNVGSGAVLEFGAGTHMLNAGAGMAGAGTVSLTGATVVVAAPTTIAAPVLMNGGTLSGTSALTLSGPLEWSAGTFTLTGTTNVNGGLSIDTGGAKSLFQRVMTNNASTTWSAGQVSTGGGADFINAVAASFTTSFDGSWLYNLGGGISAFTNQGTFTKSGGSGVTMFTSTFDNSGTVHVNSGTLQLAGGGSGTGAFVVGAGATLQIAGGTYALNTGTSMTGAGTVSVTGGNLMINAPMTLAAPLSLAGGTVNGSGALTLSGPMEWSSGTMSGAGSTTFTGGLTLDTSAGKSLSQRALKNAGTTTWSAGQVSTGGTGNFTNAAGATFNDTFDGSWLYNLGGGQSLFTNLGTFSKSGGTGSTLMGAAFNNSATVNVGSGTLSLIGGGANTGAFAAGAGATLEFAGGTYGLNTGTTMTGAGAASLSSGTLTVNAPMTLGVASFQYAGGTLNGGGTLTHAGAVTWSSGIITGTGTTNFNGGLSIQGSAGKSLSQRVLTNNGTTTWSAGQVSTGAAAQFINASGATFNNTFDGSWLYNLGGGVSTFANQGTFTKSAGAGTTTISSFFNNTGSVSVASGTLALAGGGDYSSTMAAGGLATLAFAGGTHSLETGGTLAGSGTAALTADTLTVNAAVTLTVANFNFTGGTQNGAGDLALTGTSNWDGTTFSGAGATDFKGPLVLSTNVTRTLSQRTLTSALAATWSAGQVNTGAGAAFINAAGGFFTTTFDGSWLYNLGGVASTFSNLGTFTKSGGSGTTLITANFSNSGTVNASSGTLTLNAVTQLTGNTLTGGTWNVNNATLGITTGSDIATIGPGASVTLSGAASVFTRVNPVASNQGAFTVSGGRTFTTAGALSNSGVLTASSGGALNVTGNLDNSGTVNATVGTLSATTATQLSGSTLTGGNWNANNGTIAISSGPSITTIGPAASVTLSGAGSVFANVNSLSLNQGSFTVSGGRTFTTTGNLGNSGVLTVGSNSTLKVVGTLTNTGTVDLAPGTLLLDYTGTSPIDTLRGQLFTGRAGGAWNGAGVHSSTAAAQAQHLTAIGYAEASTLLGLSGSQVGIYAGLPVDATTVLTRYTYYGDANMDGKVNADDLALIDRGFGRHLTGWINGDFNYDGVVNAADYVLIDRSLVLQGSPLAPAALQEHTAEFGPAYVAEVLASVPEPGWGLAAAGVMLIGGRRRRSGHCAVSWRRSGRGGTGASGS